MVAEYVDRNRGECKKMHALSGIQKEQIGANPPYPSGMQGIWTWKILDANIDDNFKKPFPTLTCKSDEVWNKVGFEQ